MAELDPVVSELDAELARLQAEMTRVREFRAWWVQRHPNTAAPSRRSDRQQLPMPSLDAIRRRMTLRAYIGDVLDEGHRLTVRQIIAAVEARGWQTDAKNKDTMVRNTLRRMQEDGEIGRDGSEYFSLRPSGLLALQPGASPAGSSTNGDAGHRMPASEANLR